MSEKSDKLRAMLEKEKEQTAESRMRQTMEQLLKQNPAPDKEQNQMAWVQHMNSLKAQAEELVLTELIYS